MLRIILWIKLKSQALQLLGLGCELNCIVDHSSKNVLRVPVFSLICHFWQNIILENYNWKVDSRYAVTILI